MLLNLFFAFAGSSGGIILFVMMVGTIPCSAIGTTTATIRMMVLLTAAMTITTPAPTILSTTARIMLRLMMITWNRHEIPIDQYVFLTGILIVRHCHHHIIEIMKSSGGGNVRVGRRRTYQRRSSGCFPTRCIASTIVRVVIVIACRHNMRRRTGRMMMRRRCCRYSRRGRRDSGRVVMVGHRRSCVNVITNFVSNFADIANQIANKGSHGIRISGCGTCG
mmetsp:Transcript_2213/g.3629  ORF Transcript_2213/g.3629 Transcript_2213/m.3629 type:complete len:221 (+) Transcript_2213:4757-5419(+)